MLAAFLSAPECGLMSIDVGGAQGGFTAPIHQRLSATDSHPTLDDTARCEKEQQDALKREQRHCEAVFSPELSTAVGSCGTLIHFEGLPASLAGQFHWIAALACVTARRGVHDAAVPPKNLGPAASCLAAFGDALVADTVATRLDLDAAVRDDRASLAALLPCDKQSTTGAQTVERLARFNQDMLTALAIAA